jgi:hypothetical protein
MHAAFEFLCQRRVNHAVAIEAAPAAKCLGHDGNPEMGLAARLRAGVAFVLMGFIGHVEAGGREGFRELVSDAVAPVHGLWLSGSHAPRSMFARAAIDEKSFLSRLERVTMASP